MWVCAVGVYLRGTVDIYYLQASCVPHLIEFDTLPFQNAFYSPTIFPPGLCPPHRFQLPSRIFQPLTSISLEQVLSREVSTLAPGGAAHQRQHRRQSKRKGLVSSQLPGTREDRGLVGGEDDETTGRRSCSERQRWGDGFVGEGRRTTTTITTTRIITSGNRRQSWPIPAAKRRCCGVAV